ERTAPPRPVGDYQRRHRRRCGHHRHRSGRHSMIRPPAWLMPLLLASLAGCMPPHQPPPTEAAFTPPASWRAEGVRASEISAHWWRAFGDAQLTALVEAALAHNSDVLIAASRVEQAREQIRLSHAALLPNLDAVLGAQRTREL